MARGEVDLVACRKPPVVPAGWEFHPLLEDRFAIVCRAGNPLARARALAWAELARETWLLLPVSVAARSRFDELAACQFPQPARTYPVVTRSLTMVWWLLRNRDLLALLPLNLVRPLLDAGELVELAIGETVAMEPLGVLQPQGQLGEAAARLSAFLREFRFDKQRDAARKPRGAAAAKRRAAAVPVR